MIATGTNIELVLPNYVGNWHAPPKASGAGATALLSLGLARLFYWKKHLVALFPVATVLICSEGWFCFYNGSK